MLVCVRSTKKCVLNSCHSKNQCAWNEYIEETKHNKDEPNECFYCGMAVSGVFVQIDGEKQFVCYQCNS